jgi:ubiquinone/menaquinone biosynthesis C-methylase UbiE
MADERKKIEREHYERKATSAIDIGKRVHPAENGARSIRPALRAPYVEFENSVRAIDQTSFARFGSALRVLDIAAGTGTYSLMAEHAALRCATDISVAALRLARARAERDGIPLETVCADAENLPFADDAFGLVTAAGSLYCFDTDALMNEIHRVTAENGTLVVVDALNHNPIYELNRLVGFFRGTRTWAAVVNVPRLDTVRKLRKWYKAVDYEGYGILSFLAPVLSKVRSEETAAKWIDAFDRTFPRLRRYGFKIVAIAKNPLKSGPIQ